MGRVLAASTALCLSFGISIGFPTVAGAAGPIGPQCGNTSTGNIAITDLGSRTYQGEQGGLYPGGSNVPPAAYQGAGVRAAQSVVPRAGSGSPDPNGRIVLLSIGMSNARMEFQYFANSETNDTGRNPSVVMVNGAQDGKVAANWISSSADTWSVLEQRLAAAGVTDQQVEVIWLKEANYVHDVPAFQPYAQTLTQQLRQITGIAAQRFPNLLMLFVSARTYAGYSGIYPSTPLNGANPEPWAYQTGFADKWFVAQSVADPSQRPWIGWGPYFWTDGTRGRADGLTWSCADTGDGTHPSASGQAKVNGYMRPFFLNSIFTPWFSSSAYVPPPSPSPVPSPVPTPVPTASPATAPGASPPVGSVQPSNRPPATQQPGSATPVSRSSPVANLPAPLGGAVSAVSALPASQRWPLIAVLIGALAAAMAGIAFPILRRRRRARPIVRRPTAPNAVAAQQAAITDGSSGAREMVGVARPGEHVNKPPHDR